MVGSMDKIIKTPVKAIRKKCLDCCNNQRKEVRLCTIINCAIYPYRFGRRPDKAVVSTIREFYDKKAQDAMVLLGKNNIVISNAGHYYNNEIWYNQANSKKNTS